MRIKSRRHETDFESFWESTVSPGTPQDVVNHWRKHEMAAVQRGGEVVNRLSAIVPIRGKRVLDLGCGYGGISVAVALAGASVIGVDFADHRLQGARIRAEEDCEGCEVRFVQSSGERLSFAENSFDIVVCNDVLEHVQNHANTLAEIARVLRKGGVLYLQFPNRLSLENLKCDPHYGLFGISILSPSLGRRYVVTIRRRSRSYDVGTFPIAACTLRSLRDSGVEIIGWWPAPRRSVGWLTPLLVAYRQNTTPIITALFRKS